MTPKQRLALVGADDRDAVGEEAGNTPDSDILHPLHVAIEFAKLTRRVSELERDNRENRSVINRILTRFATEGRPIPPEAV